METPYKLSETMVWTSRKVVVFSDEFLNRIDVQNIRCMKFDHLRAVEMNLIIESIKKYISKKNIPNLRTITIGRYCEFDKKLLKEFCKLIGSMPSITELIFNAYLLNRNHFSEIYKEFQKLSTLRQISIGTCELIKKEDLKLAKVSHADLSLVYKCGCILDKHIDHFAVAIKNSTTIRSLELQVDAPSASSLYPALAINTSITRLIINLYQPYHDFAPLKPLADHNLQDLEVDAQRRFTGGAAMNVIFDILDNNTRLTRLSLKKCNDIQGRLGSSLMKNTSLRSLTLADLDVTPELLEGFKLNTSLTEISITSDTYLSICQSFVDAPKRSLRSLTLRHGPVLNPMPRNEPRFALNQLLKTVPLTTLEINGFADVDVDLLIEGLNDPNNRITTLKFCNGSLKKEMIPPFMKMMERNSTIRHLDLSNTNFDGDVMYKHVWNMIRLNRTLRKLVINQPSGARTVVSDESFQKLMKALKVNATLLYLVIQPRSVEKCLEIFLEDQKYLDLSLWQLVPLTDCYQADLILRNNMKKYLDKVVIYHNIMRSNGTALPREIWIQIFSYLIHPK